MYMYVIIANYTVVTPEEIEETFFFSLFWIRIWLVYHLFDLLYLYIYMFTV